MKSVRKFLEDDIVLCIDQCSIKIDRLEPWKMTLSLENNTEIMHSIINVLKRWKKSK